jgi:hypothetical protein
MYCSNAKLSTYNLLAAFLLTTNLFKVYRYDNRNTTDATAKETVVSL